MLLTGLPFSLCLLQRCPEPWCEPVGPSKENLQRSPAAQGPPDAGPGGGLRPKPEHNLSQFPPPLTLPFYFMGNFLSRNGKRSISLNCIFLKNLIHHSNRMPSHWKNRRQVHHGSWSPGQTEVCKIAEEGFNVSFFLCFSLLFVIILCPFSLRFYPISTVPNEVKLQKKKS